jgi:hypothetical protein
MTSNEIKNAFAAHGIKVRVKALNGRGFRVCTVDGSAHEERSQIAAASILLTNSAGQLGGFVNQAHEMFCYAPGKFIRV